MRVALLASLALTRTPTQNDLQFLRLRGKEHEIMIYAGAQRSNAARLAPQTLSPPPFERIRASCTC